MTLNHKKKKYIFTNESLSIKKNIQSGSRNLTQCSPSTTQKEHSCTAMAQRNTVGSILQIF